MKNHIFFIVGALSFLSSCGNDYSTNDNYIATTSLYIDNSVDTNVFVTFTDLDNDSTIKVEVGGFSLKKKSIPYGRYTVDAITGLDSVLIDGEEILLDIDTDGYNASYNLNLSKEDYIMENMVYTLETHYAAEIESDFTYTGETYEGVDATVIPGALLVPTKWNYNIDREFPEHVELPAGKPSTIKTKIYRPSDFILYRKLYEIYGDSEETGDGSIW